MMPFAPHWIFTVLGPLLLLLGLVRLILAGGLGPQTKTWLILGALFSFAAAWLWLLKSPVP